MHRQRRIKRNRRQGRRKLGYLASARHCSNAISDLAYRASDPCIDQIDIAGPFVRRMLLGFSIRIFRNWTAMFFLHEIKDAHLRARCGAYSRRSKLRTVLSALALVFLSACARHDPQAAFDHARETLRKGDTVAAAAESEKGYKDFHAVAPEWAWRFAILKARVLHLRGLNDEALKLLSSEPAPLPSGELAVQKLRWEGLAYASLQ